MIRILLILLVLGNLAAFGLASGLVESWWPAGREPGRLTAQVAPERLVVLPAGGARAPAGAAGAAGAATGPSGAATGPQPGSGIAAGAAAGPAETGSGSPAAISAGTVPAPAGAPGASPTASPASAAAVAAAAGLKAQCLEAGPLDEARAERVRQWARGLRPGLQAGLERRPETPSFMVYLPSPSAAEAQRRLAQLRQAGVADIYAIPDGALRNAISLGIFSAQEGARTRLDEITARGFSGARIGPGPTRPERTMARLTRSAPATEAAWIEARARLQELAGIDPVACVTP